MYIFDSDSANLKKKKLKYNLLSIFFIKNKGITYKLTYSIKSSTMQNYKPLGTCRKVYSILCRFNCNFYRTPTN